MVSTWEYTRVYTKCVPNGEVWMKCFKCVGEYGGKWGLNGTTFGSAYSVPS
jgi:hypothetical protein